MKLVRAVRDLAEHVRLRRWLDLRVLEEAGQLGCVVDRAREAPGRRDLVDASLLLRCLEERARRSAAPRP